MLRTLSAARGLRRRSTTLRRLKWVECINEFVPELWQGDPQNRCDPSVDLSRRSAFSGYCTEHYSVTAPKALGLLKSVTISSDSHYRCSKCLYGSDTEED